jgi:hypothetical protein
MPTNRCWLKDTTPAQSVVGSITLIHISFYINYSRHTLLRSCFRELLVNLLPSDENTNVGGLYCV